MARWFDNAAKAAARREVAQTSPTAGFDRRTALKRGAVVAGVAWTAPMLMQTRAYAGISTCTAPSFPCAPAPNSGFQPICCSSLQTCSNLTSGAPVCSDPNAPGGTCSNQGVGECTSSNGIKSNCNGKLDQCNGCSTQYICGGEGAPCNNVDICAPSLYCAPSSYGSTGSYCRKQCTADNVSVKCNTKQICDSKGYCAQDCGPTGTNGTCQGKETCVSDPVSSAKICSYAQK